MKAESERVKKNHRYLIFLGQRRSRDLGRNKKGATKVARKNDDKRRSFAVKRNEGEEVTVSIKSDKRRDGLLNRICQSVREKSVLSSGTARKREKTSSNNHCRKNEGRKTN